MSNENLIIEKPQRATLVLNLQNDAVDYVIIEVDGSWRHGRIKVDVPDGEPMKVLEEAVYAEPWLIGDYARTVVVVPSTRFAVVPASVADDESSVEAFVATMWPDAKADAKPTVERPCNDAAIVALPDAKVAAIVSRTLNNAVLADRMASIVRFFASQSRPTNNVKLYANFSDRRTLDIVAFAPDKLLLANTFDCREPLDAVYFIMAAVKDCGYDALEDEIVLAGNAERLRPAMEELRKYINSVMPLLMPVQTATLPIELQKFTEL